MLTERMRNKPDLTHTLWAGDTGCFAHPERFDLGRYLNWLEEWGHVRHNCLFATAPDAWGDGAATWEQARPILPQIRALGYRAALVAQPRLERLPLDWGAFDALFLGGPDWWQGSQAALGLCAEAKRRGLWLHKGRVNSERRLMGAMAAGFDSADGTFLAFGPDTNLPRMERWLAKASIQLAMEVS